MMTISWSENAKIDYWDNIEYLEREWTLTEVYNFMDKVDELIGLLAQENLTFKPTNYKNTFQVPVVKQINLYYRVENNNIELLRFWNNYQDLAKFHL
jgi:plasmid stabilization system protein ParE